MNLEVTMNLLENIDVLKVSKFLNANKINDIERYNFLIKNLQTENLVSSRSYQRKFNYFYKVRRDTSWQQTYYAIFEQEKKRIPSFERIIREIWQKTDRIEASFSSKMVATIDPNMPVWDKYVLQNLHLKLEETKEQRLHNAILLYDQMAQYYHAFLQTDEANRAIGIFDQILSDYKCFTPTKKIDLILWQSR